MATVIKILNEFARRVKDPSIQSILDNTDSTNEQLGCLESACGRIFRDYDWKTLRRQGYLAAQAGQSLFPYPADYDKILTWGMFSSQLQAWLTAETPDEQYNRQISANSGDRDNKFREIWNGFQFTYPFSTDCALLYDYKSKNYVKSQDASANPVYIDYIADDDDEILFDKELIIAAAAAERAIKLQDGSQQIEIQKYLDLLEILKNQDQARAQKNTFCGSFGAGLTAARAIAGGGGSY